MLKVFCTKIGEKYSWDYVAKLASAFHRHLNLPFQFVCTTDRLAGAPLLPHINMLYTSPRRKCAGWWNLQEAYSNPVWAEDDQVLYTGLDTIITRNITSVIAERIEANMLTMMRDFSELIPNHNSMYVGTYADGVCFIPRGGVPYLWKAFIDCAPPDYYPMHVFNTEIMKERGEVPDFWQDVAPDLLCSYKWPTVKTNPTKEAIVVFHGEPRPAQAVIETPWLVEHWK